MKKCIVIYELFASMVAQGRMGHPMRLELTRVGLLVYLANRTPPEVPNEKVHKKLHSEMIGQINLS